MVTVGYRSRRQHRVVACFYCGKNKSGNKSYRHSIRTVIVTAFLTQSSKCNHRMQPPTNRPLYHYYPPMPPMDVSFENKLTSAFLYRSSLHPCYCGSLRSLSNVGVRGQGEKDSGSEGIVLRFPLSILECVSKSINPSES